MRIIIVTLVCLVAISAWSLLAVYAAFYGWGMNPVVEQGNTKEFYAWAIREIETGNPGNTAFVLLHNGEVAKQY